MILATQSISNLYRRQPEYLSSDGTPGANDRYSSVRSSVASHLSATQVQKDFPFRNLWWTRL